MAYRAFDIGLPFEATGRTPRNPNNPIAINNEIRNQVHSDAYQQRGAEKYISPYIEGQDKRFLTANYDQQYLGYLLGNPTGGQTGQQQTNPLHPDIPGWDKVNERLDANNKQCRNFLDAVVKKLNTDNKKLPDIASVINRIGGVRYNDKLVETTTGGQVVFDRRLNKKFPRVIELRPIKNTPAAKDLIDKNKFHYDDDFIETILHELLHHASPFDTNSNIRSHTEMAQAVYDVIDSESHKEIEKILQSEWGKIKKDEKTLASRYANEAIKKYCPRVMKKENQN
jgi:hypothetical protein